MENIKKIVNFLFELSGAKTTPRTGWQRIGIKTPESLADHAALSAQIAYILALMEGANPDRAAALALFRDTAKLRSGDRNWVARAYSGDDGAEEKAQGDQLAGLPVAEELKEVFNELKERKTKEAVIAADAAWLDTAIQSIYYSENGNKKALLWLESAKIALNTKSAKEVFAALESAGIEDWWMELDSIKRRFGMPGEK